MITDDGVMRIDLNADLGETTDLADVTRADDEAMLTLVSSANLACGGHAGDLDTMRRLGAAAADHGVSLGAHVSYLDREGFGRRPRNPPPEELRRQVAEQIETLITAVAGAGVGAGVGYVKPHGALYHAIETDQSAADAVVAAIRDVDPALTLLGRPGVLSARRAEAAGLTTATEAFADRGYLPSGALVPRDSAGAVLHDPDLVAERCLAIATGEPILDVNGDPLLIRAESICVHGDTPGAVAIAARIAQVLTHAGVQVSPFTAAG